MLPESRTAAGGDERCCTGEGTDEDRQKSNDGGLAGAFTGETETQRRRYGDAVPPMLGSD